MITPKPLRADVFPYPEAKCTYSKKPTPQDPNNVLYTVTGARWTNPDSRMAILSGLRLPWVSSSFSLQSDGMEWTVSVGTSRGTGPVTDPEGVGSTLTAIMNQGLPGPRVKCEEVPA